MFAEFDWTAKTNTIVSFRSNTREMDLVVTKSIFIKTNDNVWYVKWKGIVFCTIIYMIIGISRILFKLLKGR